MTNIKILTKEEIKDVWKERFSSLGHIQSYSIECFFCLKTHPNILNMHVIIFSNNIYCFCNEICMNCYILKHSMYGK